MENLPKDPFMLISVINMKLRDFYPDLDALCEDMNIDIEELSSALKKSGFEYDKNSNRFM